MQSKIIFLLLVSISCAIALQTVNGRIKITVITTAYCSDTVTFIQNHLRETYSLYSDYLEVEFLPWGRTQRNVDGSLTCQFGVADCWSNRVHRCALDMLKGNQTRQLEFMSCEFVIPITSSYRCAQEMGLNLIDLDYCVSSSAGDHLDTAAETASVASVQIINFIPAIIFNNDQPSRDVSMAAFANLRNMVCQALAADPITGVNTCT
ncbi:GILT-like protein 1 [Eumeta japonica]|uniref:GILT-like protein 1 n=1 Tax=Eumeta variegata TaxID=151549 RepID=A0A4C1VDJ3_EUMVA|nr:GILT-like protein 1 [Eumeta japonica]